MCIFCYYKHHTCVLREKKLLQQKQLPKIYNLDNIPKMSKHNIYFLSITPLKLHSIEGHIYIMTQKKIQKLQLPNKTVFGTGTLTDDLGLILLEVTWDLLKVAWNLLKVAWDLHKVTWNLLIQ